MKFWATLPWLTWTFHKKSSRIFIWPGNDIKNANVGFYNKRLFWLIILGISTGNPFYIKIMCFASFFRIQIHSWNANVLWTLQFTSSGRGAVWYLAVSPGRPFYILRYLWSDGEGEENCGGVGRKVGEIGQPSLIGRIVFHILFIL